MIVGVVVMGVAAGSCYGFISVGTLSKARAAEMGIVMRQAPNGDAGVKVWIEFARDGVMKDVSYCEMRMADGDGKHVVSARLEPNAGVYGLDEGLGSYSFSVDPGALEKCSFFVVLQQGARTGVGYYLNAKEFFEP